ncbi:hypothetical protein [Pasteurella multocida]|uniref:hypothetical protein n=1 Tax=Pasteurella multocida TaxID=747 RepID=UPI00397A37A1
MKKAIFEIFRTGQHRGRNSNKNWSAQELKNIALMYSEKVKPAPLVIGHPQNNEPRYGQVKRLIFCENSLFAEAEIQNDLINKINANEISGISASFITLQNNENPIKGAGYYLNHVGFMEKGKDKPAVKNMLPPEISVQSLYFSEQESEVILFCEDKNLTANERLHEKARYFERVLNVNYKTAFHLATQ